MSVDNDEIDPSFTPSINWVPSLGKGQRQILLKTWRRSFSCVSRSWMHLRYGRIQQSVSGIVKCSYVICFCWGECMPGQEHGKRGCLGKEEGRWKSDGWLQITMSFFSNIRCLLPNVDMRMIHRRRLFHGPVGVESKILTPFSTSVVHSVELRPWWQVFCKPTSNTSGATIANHNLMTVASEER